MILLLRKLAALLASLTVVFLSTCTMMTADESTSTGGTGSEVVGVVEYPDSTGTAKAKTGYDRSFFPVVSGNVFINPRNYLADTAHGNESPITITGTDGSFRIDTVRPGEHLLYVRDNNGNGIAITFTMASDPKPVDLGTLIAKKTAGVSVQYNGKVPGDVLFFIDVKGTGMQLRCTSSNIAVTLGSIPTGVNHIITVRMFKPVYKGYDLNPLNLVPGAITTLQSITGD